MRVKLIIMENCTARQSGSNAVAGSNVAANLGEYGNTRRSGRYAPILLAPAEGWGPFGPLRALRALLGPSAPSRVTISKL